MRNVKLYRYQLAMDSGVILRDQKLPQREGWIVELTDAGITEYGEGAPLPAFTPERLDEAGEQVQQEIALRASKGALKLEELFQIL
mgnify:CR=1 FL=1